MPGRIVHRIALGSLKAPRFSFGGTISMTATVRNLGSVHRDYVRPRSLAATVRGERVVFPDFTVLAGSARAVRAEWSDPPRLCICHVVLETDDGRGHTLTARATVVVFPLPLVGGVLALALGLGLLARVGLRRRRRASDAASL